MFGNITPNIITSSSSGETLEGKKLRVVVVEVRPVIKYITINKEWFTLYTNILLHLLGFWRMFVVISSPEEG